MRGGVMPAAGAAPSACVPCLRRPFLLAALAPYIERVATSEPSRRCSRLLALSDEELARLAAPNDFPGILAEAGARSEDEMQTRLSEAECWAVCRHSPAYPEGLDDEEAPRALVVRGDTRHLAEHQAGRSVTVVGARRASPYGREVALALGAELARAGCEVISGLAYGIDGAVHRGSLGSGRCISVLGCGPDVAYPAAHRSLHRRLGDEGLIISELAPGTTPWRWTFPARNRIMARMAVMTVLVEAAERSGSLITADFAQDAGALVGAVPGPVTSAVSRGTNDLLVSGAYFVRSAQDVLDAVFGAGQVTAGRHGPAIEPELARFLEALERCNGSGERAAGELGWSGADAVGALTRLELAGYLDGSTLGTYTRTALDPPPQEA